MKWLTNVSVVESNHLIGQKVFSAIITIVWLKNGTGERVKLSSIRNSVLMSKR